VLDRTTVVAKPKLVEIPKLSPEVVNDDQQLWIAIDRAIVPASTAHWAVAPFAPASPDVPL